MSCNAEAERKKKLPLKEAMVPCNEHFHHNSLLNHLLLLGCTRKERS
jgi:hypothetical protein